VAFRLCQCSILTGSLTFSHKIVNSQTIAEKHSISDGISEIANSHRIFRVFDLRMYAVLSQNANLKAISTNCRLSIGLIINVADNN